MHKGTIIRDSAGYEAPMNPFVYCDVVTTTTHTSLRGPQSAMIFYRKDAKIENELFGFENKINKAVFPTLQDAPRENQIASKEECTIITGGTDNYLLLWDLGPLKLTGHNFEKICDMCNVTLNEHAIIGDSMLASSGVCIGTLAMTSRGLTEEHFQKIGDFLNQAIVICREVQNKHGKLLENYNEDKLCHQNNEQIVPRNV
ncbi:Serine hydroxymethyltransferase [Carex littledalei]|uniref:Serine hydroxymethyltransferase n=1 Tax=Carex littledalei TaxID=544730 RepID=A0A833RGR6_9POAL|nr:Serine hydroxymethyltransferase [Carex littledalei]